MTRTPTQHFLIDEVLPQYDVSASYSTRVSATAERIYSVLQHGFPIGMLTRLLFKIRDIPRLIRGKTADGEVPDNPFLKLKQLENREIVVGIIGQFWRPVPQPVVLHSLEDFLSFRKDGFCKAAMTLRIQEEMVGVCTVTTETRVIGYGDGARSRFREYWGLIGPFSGLIRKEMLRKIKKQAEKTG